MLIPHGALILVIDGSKLLLLRNRGEAATPDLELVQEEVLDNPPSHVPVEDAPDDSRESGQGRHARDDRDPHRRREALFAKEAMEGLSAAARQGAPVIVIAPPHILGMLRAAQDEPLKQHIIAEIDKDLTHRKPAEIALFLQNHQA